MAEIRVVAFDGEIVGPDTIPPGVSDRIAATLDGEVDRPYEALVVRRGPTGWTAGARRIHAELVRLPGLTAESLELALPPGGETSATVDGSPVEGFVEPAVDTTLRELERRGRARFQAFVVRADNLGSGRWQLTIDPL